MKDNISTLKLKIQDQISIKLSTYHQFSSSTFIALNQISNQGIALIFLCRRNFNVMLTYHLTGSFTYKKLSSKLYKNHWYLKTLQPKEKKNAESFFLLVWLKQDKHKSQKILNMINKIIRLIKFWVHQNFWIFGLHYQLSMKWWNIKILCPAYICQCQWH